MSTTSSSKYYIPWFYRWKFSSKPLQHKNLLGFIFFWNPSCNFASVIIIYQKSCDVAVVLAWTQNWSKIGNFYLFYQLVLLGSWGSFSSSTPVNRGRKSQEPKTREWLCLRASTCKEPRAPQPKKSGIRNREKLPLFLFLDFGVSGMKDNPWIMGSLIPEFLG